ncbi:uncharacterized protein LOC125229591 [Leguminivora glycinivorella]|uniref:uncharacterized protein LOC125229591 n=1 Tax=Leguminivora glycinivorella TaxID=1035111 RepID=UPI00200CE9C8|nr:uncharacterized protein LOC125229591 [Leguminivora glycinivorella]
MNRSVKDENEDMAGLSGSEQSLVEDEDWRISGGSIWNHQQRERAGKTPKPSRCRATTCQLQQLVKFMEKHPQLAVSHAKPFQGSDELWMQLAEHINQFGPPKTYKQCKTTWRDLRKRAFALQRSRNKKGTGRNLYGMAPKIFSLLSQDGISPSYSYVKEEDDEGSASSSRQVTPPPAPEGLPEPTGSTEDATVEKTKGEQLVIRVTDNKNSKRNVFNRFTINDGHFENIIVKEEREEGVYQPQELEIEHTGPEDIEPEDQEEMFPQPETILGGMDEVMEEKNSVIRDLNDTLRKFLVEYKTRNALMRERIDLERARLQFDMEVYRNNQMEKRVIAINAGNAANVANIMNATNAANVMNAKAANVINNTSATNGINSNSAATNNTITVGNVGNGNNVKFITVNASSAGNSINETSRNIVSVPSVENVTNMTTVTATSPNTVSTSKGSPMITINPTNTVNTGNAANNNRSSNPVMTLNPINNGSSRNAGISVQVKNNSDEDAPDDKNSLNDANENNSTNTNTESTAKIDDNDDEANVNTEEAMDETW